MAVRMGCAERVKREGGKTWCGERGEWWIKTWDGKWRCLCPDHAAERGEAFAEKVPVDHVRRTPPWGR